jgi:cytochrome-b5 reductase
MLVVEIVKSVVYASASLAVLFASYSLFSSKNDNMSSKKKISLADVQKNKKNFWTIVHGKVYDMTELLTEHPGGAEVLVAASGRDGSDDFDEVGHSEHAQQVLEKYLVGEFDQEGGSDEMKQSNHVQPTARAFKLVAIKQVSRDTSIFSLAPDLKSNSANQLPLVVDTGHHLKIIAGNISKPYTPIANDNGTLEFLIKKYDEGLVSSYVHSLKIGDLLSVSGPFGHYKRSFLESCTHAVFLCAGTGITPIYQLLTHLLKASNFRISISMFYSNKSEEDILMQSELEELQKKLPNFSITYFITRSNQLSKKSYISGRLDDKWLLANLPSHIVQPKTDQKTFVGICGTSSFNTAMKDFIKSLNYTEADDKSPNTFFVF